MDIAKIRKKALSKDAGGKPMEELEERPAEKSSPDAAGDEKREEEKEQAVGDEKGATQGEKPAEEITACDTGSDADSDADSDETSGVASPDTDEITEENAEELVELLTFSISNEEYAFRVSDVEEVLRMQRITMVPTMPDYVLGITSLRGKIIPVIDLRTRLNLQEKSLSTESAAAGPSDDPENGKKDWMDRKILIISGPKGMIGASIDKVMGVVSLPLSGMLQPPGHLDEKELKFIEGIVVVEKRFISIIHSDAAMDIEVG